MGESPYPIYQLPSSARNGPTSDPTEVVQGEWFKDKMMGGGGTLVFLESDANF